MNHKKFFVFPALLAVAALALILRADENVHIDAKGVYLASDPTDRAGAYGNAVVQPASSAQAALTNNTTGTAGTTLAAGVGVMTITVPVDLPSLANGNVSPTGYVPGYKLKLLDAQFAVTKPVTTGSKGSTLTFKLNGTAVDGFSIVLTSANCTPVGALVASTAITGNNTATATGNATLVAGSTTTFVEGQGVLLLKVQNMDTADAVASVANLSNALRSGAVGFGIIKGAP